MRELSVGRYAHSIMNTMDDEQPSQSLLLQMAALFPNLVIFLVILLWQYSEVMANYAPERGITFDFPSAQDVLSPDTLSIDIHADGTVSIAGVLFEPSDSSRLPLLRKYLRSACEAVNKHGGLLVHCDGDVRFQRLVDVLSAVTSSGIVFYGLS